MSSASDWATVALAVVALGSLVLTWRALHSTQADVQQSRYARIDARAPRVIVRQWVAPSLPAALASSSVTPVIMAMPPDKTRFDLPGQANNRVRITARVELLNEGTSTAFLRLPPGGIVVAGKDARPDEQDPTLMSWSARRPLGWQLAPAESCWLLLENEREVSEWTRLHELHGGTIDHYSDSTPADDVPGFRFIVEVDDQFAEGVRDRIVLDALCLPLIPVGGSASAWRPQASVFTPFTPPLARLHVHRTMRDYPHDPPRADRTGSD